MQIARFPKDNGSRARTVVITQGKDPTVIAFNGKVRGPCRKNGTAGLWGRSVCLSTDFDARNSTLSWHPNWLVHLSLTILRLRSWVTMLEGLNKDYPVHSAGMHADPARRCSSSR